MFVYLLTVPDNDVVESMRQREAELSRTKLVQRACSLLCSDRTNITRQIQLRVVREFGLPDSTVEVLRNAVATAALGAEFQRSPAICHDGGSGSLLAGSVNTAGASFHGPLAGPNFCSAATQHWRQIPLPLSQRQRRCQLESGRRSPLILAPMAPCPVFEVSCIFPGKVCLVYTFSVFKDIDSNI